VEPEDLDPAGERVGERRDEQDVRRAGEQEPARAAVPVDGELEDREQPGSALHLVERRACRKLGHEPRRVGLRGGAHDFVVQGEVRVAAPAADPLRQRRLAARPRPVDEHASRRLGPSQGSGSANRKVCFRAVASPVGRGAGDRVPAAGEPCLEE
jgi:hypothetical protein